MRDMTRFYVWHDSFMCVSHSYGDALKLNWSPFYHAQKMVCDMTHSSVRSCPFLRVTWLISMCDMTHSNVDLIQMTMPSNLSAVCSIRMSHVTHVNESCLTYAHFSWAEDGVHMRVAHIELSHVRKMWTSDGTDVTHMLASLSYSESGVHTHVPHIPLINKSNESCPKNEWVTLAVNQSCYIEWIMSHMN